MSIRDSWDETDAEEGYLKQMKPQPGLPTRAHSALIPAPEQPPHTSSSCCPAPAHPSKGTLQHRHIPLRAAKIEPELLRWQALGVQCFKGTLTHGSFYEQILVLSA